MATLGPREVPSPSISLMISGSQRGTLTLFLLISGLWQLVSDRENPAFEFLQVFWPCPSEQVFTPRAPTFTWSHTSLLQQTALLTPGGPESLAASDTALTLWGSRWRNECCCGFSDWCIPASWWVGVPPPPPCSWQSHVLHLQSSISSGSSSTVPVATGCSLVRSVTQLTHTGARKCPVIRRNSISEAAHLDKPFKSHCPHQDISIFTVPKPSLSLM